MPLVNVLINGRAYTVACDDGEEEHLRELATFLDKRVRELAGSVGQVGDARLLLMAGLIVSDELSEAQARVAECEKDIAALKSRTKTVAKLNPDALAEKLEDASARMEAMAAKLGA